MPRAKLTDAEREAKRKARAAFSFSNAAYMHYDPLREGYGSPDDWQAAAEGLAAGRGAFKGRVNHTRANPDLEALGLSAMPEHVNALKAAFRKAALQSHPDHGGTAEAFRSVYAAYERLTKLF